MFSCLTPVLLCCGIALTSAGLPTFNLYKQSFECIGGALGKHLENGTQEECANACIAADGCQGFVFKIYRGGTNNLCFLKSNICQAEYSRGDNVFTYTMDASGGLPFLERMYLPRFTCPENDIREVIGDYTICSKECFLDPNCKGIAMFKKEGTISCLLKTDLCKSPVLDETAIGVYQKKAFPDGYFKNVDHQVPSKDISNLLDKLGGQTLRQCKAACDNTPKCKTFEHVTPLQDANPTENCILGKNDLVPQDSFNVARSVYQKIDAPSGFTTVDHGADCPGQSLKILRKNRILDCAYGCRVTDNCAGFVWDSTTDKKNCWFKAAICDTPVRNPFHSIFKKNLH